MRKYLLSIATMMVALCSLTSCLGDGDEYIYSDDAAITSFKLGTVYTYHTAKKKDGTDSIYKRTLDAASYTFYIDHKKGEIWNPDSLPVTANAKAVLCTVTAKNGGSVSIKSMTSDSLNAYKSGDSINFTQPREFYVHSMSGAGSRKYTVRVNVHKEIGDTCVWTKVSEANSTVAGLSKMKALNVGETIYLYGVEGGSVKLFTTAINDGANWNEVVTTPVLTAEALKSMIVVDGNQFYTLSDGKVLTSADGASWAEVSTSASLKQLIATSAGTIYALNTDGQIVSSADGGAEWTVEALDEDASLLPTEGVVGATHPIATNSNTEKVVILGSRDASVYPGDAYSMVWSKVNEYSASSRNHAWSFTETSIENKYKAPRADSWQVVNYDGNNFKAVYADGTGISAIYNSGDDGITWQKDTKMTMPSALKVTNGAFAFVADSNKSIWVICGGTGQVWKTRINRLVWKEEQKYFEE